MSTRPPARGRRDSHDDRRPHRGRRWSPADPPARRWPCCGSAFGLTFLWAFFDKLLALGFATGAVTNAAGAKTGIDFFSQDAWINGGNPTLGS